ncbi:hypothetical protein Rhe02_44090 [Rhizocola hellebori]|uniref:Uncharacterized protein n=1 Tax=Rhizocola hellebori TaxID=1392758 RepID=A0A8J3VHJ7_9ACTN|nr:hypothetical protein Rhe02_44090 [Rhizocola hellebori]
MPPFMPELEHPVDDRHRLALRARVGDQRAEQKLALQMLRNERRFRPGQIDEPATDLVGCPVVEVAKIQRDLVSLFLRPQQERGRDRRKWMEFEGERRCHTEVSAASVQRPEQVGILLLARGHHLAVGGDQLDLEEVVAGEAVHSLEPAGAAAEGEPAHAGGGGTATGDGQAVGLGAAVEIADGRSPADHCCARVSIDDHRIHQAQIDDQAVLCQSGAGDTVPAAAHRDLQPGLPRVADGARNILRGQALRENPGTLVDHCVEQHAALVVLRIARLDDVSGEALDCGHLFTVGRNNGPGDRLCRGSLHVL